MLKHILRTEILADPNVGLFGVSTDDYLLLGKAVRAKDSDPVSEVLQAEVHKTMAADTNLLGLFVAANSNGIVIPKIMEDEEVDEFTNLADELDLNLVMLGTKDTALGNLILANDNGCIIPESLEPVKREIADALGVEVATGTVAGLNTGGSCGAVTNNGLIVHRGCSEEELEHLESVLGVEGNIGSVSYGSPFVGAGILANSHGFVTSQSTTGPELQRIDEALGFIEE